MRAPVPALALALLASSGCASSLRTWDGDREVRGIPFRAPALVEVERVTTYELVSADASMARYCTPDSVVTLEFMPVGEQYFVTIDPATLGKAEFSLELHEAGSLKKVTMGSDPGTAEAVEAVTGLASAVLPYVAAPREAADPTAAVAADPTARQLKDRHCAKLRTAVVRMQRRTID